MFRYKLWHTMLNLVYWVEWRVGRAVVSVESKFFKAQIDYHARYDDWNEVLNYLNDVEPDEDDEDLEDCE